MKHQLQLFESGIAVLQRGNAEGRQLDPVFHVFIIETDHTHSNLPPRLTQFSTLGTEGKKRVTVSLILSLEKSIPAHDYPSLCTNRPTSRKLGRCWISTSIVELGAPIATSIPPPAHQFFGSASGSVTLVSIIPQSPQSSMKVMVMMDLRLMCRSQLPTPADWPGTKLCRYQKLISLLSTLLSPLYHT